MHLPQNIIAWCAQNWAELTSIFITSIALIYAALAYYSSKGAAKAARSAHLTDLRMSVQTSFQEAQRGHRNLQLQCQQTRIDWERHYKRHRAPLSLQTHTPELADIRRVERDGAKLLQKAEFGLADLDQQSAKQLEQTFAVTKTTADQIENLAKRLQPPPNHFE